MEDITHRLEAAMAKEDPSAMREALSLAIDEIRILRGLVICGGCRSERPLCDEFGGANCYRRPYPN